MFYRCIWFAIPKNIETICSFLLLLIQWLTVFSLHISIWFIWLTFPNFLNLLNTLSVMGKTWHNFNKARVNCFIKCYCERTQYDLNVFVIVLLLLMPEYKGTKIIKVQETYQLWIPVCHRRVCIISLAWWLSRVFSY